ncbi:MAG TPA: xanthine dehydrogenase family protein molybdopterin-binding subunit, partial [Pseudolabrys sp.]|nr:xanthine dehydrogenase family protein molybdopterin-binding subunit [Pseudolabrys sp.]
MSDGEKFKGRREDPRFLTGQGRYTNDWNLPNQAHACFRRADRAHAIIRSVDVSAARAAPGVLLVLTAADVADAGFHTVQPIQPPPGRGGQKALVPERPVLAGERARFVGEEIALVIAETAGQARDAADLIEVDYDDLPVVIGVERAIAPGAAIIHDNIPGNVCFDFEYGDAKKTAALIEKAAHVVRVTVDSPRVAPTPMEVRGAIAAYDKASDSYDFYTPNQGTLALRTELAHAAGIDPKNLRVRMLDVGGAFGARTAPFPEYPALLFAAKKLGRPVKWLSTRTEDFLTDNHGRAITLTGELALNSKGRFLALRTDWLCDSGAYLGEAGILTNSINGLAIGAGVYQVEALYGRHRQIMTNTAPTNAYRGAGRPEANLIVERLVDEAARKLNIDPLELRRRNLVGKEEMPYKTPTGIAFDSGDFPALAAKA